MHWWDYTATVEEIMNALHNLVVSGKVLYLVSVTSRTTMELLINMSFLYDYFLMTFRRVYPTPQRGLYRKLINMPVIMARHPL